ncbi:MAG: EsaB/YukD family protein, partial [Acidimicrobiia bacterium]|nr:EsaB/YukD family protein [Acidimicrobiia bacterium]
MTSVLVTVDTPDGVIDLTVPAEHTIGDILGVVAPGVGSEDLGGWTLSEPGGRALDSTQTLEAAGVLDGTRLCLVPSGVDQPTPRRPVEPPLRRPVGASARLIVPDRMQSPERIATAVAAFLGRRRHPGARGPLDRMREAWTWTDHERRLEWLLTRPRIHRSIFIGVVGHRSDELAETLADTLARARVERVALVDGGMGGAITHRLGVLGTGFEAIASGLQRRDVTSFEQDLLFGRTRLGTLAVPAPGAHLPEDATVRGLLDGLTAHAGLIVVDCGTLEHQNAQLMERCDQIIMSTTGVAPPCDRQTIGAIWADVELSQ